MSKIHKYFEKCSSKWNITDFLEECGLEPYHCKIEAYITSLEKISDTEKGTKSNKARLLLNNYREASICFFVGSASRNKWRCKVLRESL